MTGRWFHSNLTGNAAEQILKEKGNEGTFLVRPSETTPGDFTISVLHKNEVTHIKVHNDGDCYTLVGGPDPFATLNGLVSFYMENPGSIRLKQGQVVDLVKPLLSEDPTSERWFHGPLKSKDAEALLLSRGKLGNFLVRESQSQPGQYVLSVRCSPGISHVIIKNRGDKFDVGSGLQFSSLMALVDYYKENPKLRDMRDQTPIILDQPFHSTSFVAASIEERIKELLKKGKSSSTGFREEFEKLQHYDIKEGVYSNIEGLKEEAKGKNRYKNILPYDHSRVVLRSQQGKTSTGYINANYVDSELRNHKVRYIASQGPLKATVEDFWSMCYQEKIKVIVMLTNLVERGKVKCAKYWPDLGQSEEYGKFIVDNMLEHGSESISVRELRLYHKERGHTPPMMIFQYHYINWPDHGVPSDPDPILGLLAEIHARNRSTLDATPIVVHCSAGIGRTGTVIAIDVLMHLIEEQGLNEEIDILKTTQLLRSQRAGMIQTEFQYRFVYSALQNFIQAEKIRREWQPLQSVTPYSNVITGSANSNGVTLPRASPSVSVEVHRPAEKSLPRFRTETEALQQHASPKRANARHEKRGANPKGG